MHTNEIFYALICINNNVLSCLISMLGPAPSWPRPVRPPGRAPCALPAAPPANPFARHPLCSPPRLDQRPATLLPMVNCDPARCPRTALHSLLWSAVPFLLVTDCLRIGHRQAKDSATLCHGCFGPPLLTVRAAYERSPLSQPTGLALRGLGTHPLLFTFEILLLLSVLSALVSTTVGT